MHIFLGIYVAELTLWTLQRAAKATIQHINSDGNGIAGSNVREQSHSDQDFI